MHKDIDGIKIVANGEVWMEESKNRLRTLGTNRNVFLKIE